MYGTIPASYYSLPHLSLLSLRQNNLTGSLPPEIALLANLTELDLSQNQLTGTIPPELGSLSRLSSLRLTKNDLRGTFPVELCKLANLTQLYLSANNFHGGIPNCIGNFTVIEELYLGENYFTGHLPPSLGTLVHILALDVSDNWFSGSLLDSIGNFKELAMFYVYSNMFTGTLPASFSRLSNVRIFDMYRNCLHGSIDTQLNNMTQITYIDVHENMLSRALPSYPWPTIFFVSITTNFFTGILPDGYGDSRSINYIEFGNNLLSGTIPSSYGAARSLSYLAINDNRIPGSIPYMGGNVLLAQVFLDNNLLTGNLPASLGNLSILAEIDASYNKLTGTIPALYSELRNLQIFFVSNNKLFGTLQGVFNSTTQRFLTDVDVSHNFFGGDLPTSPFYISTLRSFAASANCFVGTLPVDICSARNLSVLILDGLSTAPSCRVEIFPGVPYLNAFILQHSLTGSIPSCLFTLPHIRSLHLNGNKLTGSLPSTLNVSSSLLDLALSHNFLEGTIPVSLQTRAFHELDLSYNRLRGVLSKDFSPVAEDASLSLQVNRLSGDIPNSLKNAGNITILDGNMFYCDFERSTLPPNDPESEIYVCGSNSVNRSIYAYLVFWLLPLFMVLFSIAYYVRTKNMKTVHYFYMGYEYYCYLDDTLRSPPYVCSHPKLTSQASRPISCSWVTTVAVDSEEVQKLVRFFDEMKRLFGYVGLFIFVICLPIFMGVSQMYKSYDHEYGWQVSAVLLEGINASIMLTLVFSAVLIFAIACLVRLLYRLDALHLSCNSEKNKNHELETYGYKTYIRLFLLMLVNLITMIVVDCVYVYIVINFNATVVAVAQIVMALFKILWNEGALWVLVPFMKRDLIKPALILAGIKRKSSHALKTVRRFTVGEVRKASLAAGDRVMRTTKVEDISEQDSVVTSPMSAPQRKKAGLEEDSEGGVHIELTRSVDVPVRPSVRFTILDDDPPKPTLSSDLSTNDQGTKATESSVVPTQNDNISATSSPAESWKAYNAADIRFLVFNTMLNNIIVPAVAIACVTSNCFNNALIAEASDGDTYVIQQCAVFLVNYYSSVDVCAYQEPVVKTVTYNPPFIYSYQCASTISINYSAVYIFMFTIVGLIVPLSKILIHVVYHSLDESNSYKLMLYRILPARFHFPTSNDNPNVLLFHRGKFSVKIVSYLAIIVAFGTIFPPLAMIGCVSTIVILIVEQFLIGTCIANADRNGWYAYRTLLSAQCVGTVDLFNTSVWQIMPFVCLVLGYLIFDTMGYTEGWVKGLTITLIFVSPPFLSRIIQRCFERIFYPVLEDWKKRSKTTTALVCRAGSATSSVPTQRLTRVASIFLSFTRDLAGQGEAKGEIGRDVEEGEMVELSKIPPTAMPIMEKEKQIAKGEDSSSHDK
ncbi:hypothetical protein EON65_24775 [archaeon]|nr:MAG: hypothetical protein EON65_24775 [archaeon]